MKKVLAAFCWVLIAYAIYFPLSYFGKEQDLKEVRLSHILVDTLEEAQDIKQKINEGKNFEDLAKEFSKDEQSKGVGGDIGFSQRGNLEKPIEELVFKMDKNEISEPIESHYGWHIIKSTDKQYYSESKNFKYNPYKYLDL